MKKSFIITASIIGFVILFITIFIIMFFVSVGKVSKNNEVRFLYVEEGSTYSSIAKDLKNENFIKSEFFYKLYLKLNKPKSDLEAGYYKLSESMNVNSILKVLSSGASDKSDIVTKTFREGLHMRKYATIISEFSKYTEAEVIAKQADEEYLNSLINEYWFLTDDIKNKDIYYALEGYLFPDTYEFRIEASLEEIFETFLNNTDAKLTPYKEAIELSNYTIHEMITLASIVELEAGTADDRAGVAGVFYNRLEDGWSLGSDVTTYYGLKLDMYERDLYQTEIDEVNAYNTRPSAMAGKLPVGPICNPGIESLKAAINPEHHDYFYFVADKYGETYFNKTLSGHESTVQRLKDEGLWYEYD